MGEYICIGVGTNATHKTVIAAYATAHGLTHNDCGEYICVGVGTQQSAHRTFLAAYADAHDLETVESDTSCPE